MRFEPSCQWFVLRQPLFLLANDVLINFWLNSPFVTAIFRSLNFFRFSVFQDRKSTIALSILVRSILRHSELKCQEKKKKALIFGLHNFFSIIKNFFLYKMLRSQQKSSAKLSRKNEKFRGKSIKMNLNFYVLSVELIIFSRNSLCLCVVYRQFIFLQNCNLALNSDFDFWLLRFAEVTQRDFFNYLRMHFFYIIDLFSA